MPSEQESDKKKKIDNEEIERIMNKKSAHSWEINEVSACVCMHETHAWKHTKALTRETDDCQSHVMGKIESGTPSPASYRLVLVGRFAYIG